MEKSQSGKVIIMGNQAIIVGENSNIGLYLHWNGGMDTVKPLLDYCALIAPQGGLGERFHNSGLTIITTVMSNFFGNDGGNVDVVSVSGNKSDIPYDNGIYVVDGWEIVERRRKNGQTTEQDSYDYKEVMRTLDSRQPERNQIPELVESELTYPEDIKIGDKIVTRKVWQKENDPHALEVHKVIRFGEDRYINGYNVHGKPFTDKYGEDNINSYTIEPAYVLKEK